MNRDGDGDGREGVACIESLEGGGLQGELTEERAAAGGLKGMRW